MKLYIGTEPVRHYKDSCYKDSHYEDFIMMPRSVKTFLNRSILNEVDICSECRLHSVDMFCTYTAQTTAQLPPNFGEIGILINFLKQKGKLF